MQDILDLGDYLKNNGIKPSYQRIKIFEYLVSHKNHPNVDTIFRELVKEIPTLSKTTVYNTLNLFVEKRVATVIVIEENETRYDADTSLHGHFKCNICKNIYDIKINDASFKTNDLDGFEIEEEHLYFKGICKNCIKKNN